ncbi:MAG: ABC transporter ATP-binding protein [Tissierellia bacterium]|nr:ABC transporter ATP-binding protein [Tissierellia bacterium]
MKLLEMEDITRVFELGGVKNPVLKGISFSIEEGEFVTVMGQSGSGKSTLLYRVSGIDPEGGGRILLKGEDLSKKSQDEMADLRLKRMGFVFQNNYLLKNLNILDNIALPALKGGMSKGEATARAQELMEELGIGHIGAHPIQKVSGGQLQRAAVCRAMINGPDILFADEPTGALNSKNSQEVMDIFNELNGWGTTVMMVTHDAKIAAQSERIIYLKDGRLEDELHLGKDEGPTLRAQREERTHRWLMEKGF